MGDHLSHRKNQGFVWLFFRIMLSLFPNNLVELCWPWLIDHASGGIQHHLIGNMTNGDDIVSPIVYEKGIGILLGTQLFSKHGGNLSFGHGSMRAQGG